jgi:DNA-binding XRE family transcriptional regulator
LNTLGDHIRASRIERGLFQSQVAEQIGVHELTICNWEGNESQPAIHYIPAILRFLGYDPFEPDGSFPQRLVTSRRACGLTQKELAVELGVNPSTIQVLGTRLAQAIPKETGPIDIDSFLTTDRTAWPCKRYESLRLLCWLGYPQFPRSIPNLLLTTPLWPE